MSFLGLGKWSETYLAVVTLDGPGRLRINGIRTKNGKTRKTVEKHVQTVCWLEFSKTGGLIGKGTGPARVPNGDAERLLRDLPTMPAWRSVLERLQDGQESAAKWLQRGDEAKVS
jgi:hypothetical protein